MKPTEQKLRPHDGPPLGATRLLILIETLRTWNGLPPTFREVSELGGVTISRTYEIYRSALRRGWLKPKNLLSPRALVLSDLGHAHLAEALPTIRPLPLPGARSEWDPIGARAGGP